ncbi:uncharacterized protein CCR75_002114 [Bremia lactucae]|uniref:WD repeat-containing protein 6 n=1 Tax=Bremia lactucae TaxID=4779 RepID=A0A976FE28_BRELC|nr:hypothetical protein CCR75_002114 [Bremia lactucae]
MINTIEITSQNGPSSSAFTKQDYLGPVTLVTFSSCGSLLYVGVGPTIFLYATTTSEFLGKHDVFTRGILHGCDIVLHAASESFVGAFFGQKRVSCFQQLPQNPDAARSHEQLAVLGTSKVFCDWVFDVQLLTSEITAIEDENLLVAVGLAHNLVQIWDPVRNSILRTAQCAERCILYSLAFHGRSLDELIVASGTVFQQILLWNPMEITNDVAKAAIMPIQRLHAHNGVLFKLVWSSDARSLASVSDDRSVQLWSHHSTITPDQLDAPRSLDRTALLFCSYSPVFRSWGHAARIWDVSFWKCGVVTASEDGLCKVWDLNGKCVATLQGHMGHVWRAAVHPSLMMIASGGGDNAVKLWDVSHELMSSSHAAGVSDFCKTVTIPTTFLKKKEGDFLSQSVRNIVFSAVDNGKAAFVASEHGDIFRLDLLSLKAVLFFTICSIDGGVQAKAGSLSTFTLDFSGRFLLLGDRLGRVMIVDASIGILLHSWYAQTNVRVMKLWWDQEDAIFVSSADGVLAEWKPLVAEATDKSASPSVKTELVRTFKIPAKSSASSLLVIDRVALRNVIVGDGHGGVYIFHRSLYATVSDDQSKIVTPPTFVLKGAHGRDFVASLLLSGKDEDASRHQLVMLSGGHDGYICRYVLDSDAFGALKATQVGRESIRNISTVRQLWWSKSAAHGKATHNLMVFGFHANQAILYNLSAHYRLFNVECGGWRRPHALFTRAAEIMSSMLSHTFLFTLPAAQKQQIVVKVHSTLFRETSDSNTVPRFLNLSLHGQYHGRMTTCVAFLGKDRMVTASDDNSLMLHRQRATNCTGLRWGVVATGIAHTTTVRALITFQRENVDGIFEHIILSGGGKQRLNLWCVCGESDLLRHVCGQDRAGAAQDHRILGLATFVIPSVSGAYRLVAACNSEGSTQLSLLDFNHGKFIEIGDLNSISRKPILSCVGFQDGDNDLVIAGLAVGTTDGIVTLWDLGALLREIGMSLQLSEDIRHIKEKLKKLISELQPIFEYLAHDMGVNCINLVSCKSTEKGSLDVTLISGGDDQNLNLRELRFPACLVLTEVRLINASGAAIKTVASIDSKAIFAAGYDQRVSRWSINHTDNGTKIERQGAAFSECADIAKLAIRKASTRNAYEVVVVGQGLQMIQFQRK